MTEALNETVVTREIESFVRSQFGGPGKAVIDVNTELFREGIVDSMGVLTLLRFLEQQFRVEIAPQEMLVEHFASIAAMRDFVLTKQA